MNNPDGYTYSLHFCGLYGKKRKRDLTCFELFFGSGPVMNEEVATKFAHGKLEMIKAKDGGVWEVIAYPTQISGGFRQLGITEGLTIAAGIVRKP